MREKDRKRVERKGGDGMRNEKEYDGGTSGKKRGKSKEKDGEDANTQRRGWQMSRERQILREMRARDRCEKGETRGPNASLTIYEGAVSLSGTYRSRGGDFRHKNSLEN